jgi:hypothetical protein
MQQFVVRCPTCQHQVTITRDAKGVAQVERHKSPPDLRRACKAGGKPWSVKGQAVV